MYVYDMGSVRVENINVMYKLHGFFNVLMVFLLGRTEVKRTAGGNHPYSRQEIRLSVNLVFVILLNSSINVIRLTS